MHIKITCGFLLLMAFSRTTAISFHDYYYGNEQLHIPSHEKAIDEMVQSHELKLSGINLTDLTDFDAKHVPGLNTIQKLDLSSNQLLTLPDNIGELADLSSLNLDSNQLSQLPESMSRLTKVRSLALSNNQFSSLPKVINRFPELKDLSLFNNPLPLRTNIDIQNVLRLAAVGTDLRYKSPAQEITEQILFNAITAGKVESVRRRYASIMTGKITGIDGKKIDISKIQDANGNNLLHLVIQAMYKQINPLRSQASKIRAEKTLSEQEKKQKIDPLLKEVADLDQKYTKIFGILILQGGPSAEEMLLARDKNGNDVIHAALGTLGPDSELVRSLLLKPWEKKATTTRMKKREPKEQQESSVEPLPAEQKPASVKEPAPALTPEDIAWQKIKATEMQRRAEEARVKKMREDSLIEALAKKKSAVSASAN